jgi:hypothetical protein
MTRKLTIFALGFASCVVLCLGGCDRRQPQPESVPATSDALPKKSVLDELDPDAISRVDITTFSYSAGKRKKRTWSSNDPKGVATLIASFSPRTPVTPHKCASRGEIVFHGKQESIKLHILPGHEENRYEVRNPDSTFYFSISREPFVRALEAMGVPDIPQD